MFAFLALFFAFSSAPANAKLHCTYSDVPNSDTRSPFCFDDGDNQLTNIPPCKRDDSSDYDTSRSRRTNDNELQIGQATGAAIATSAAQLGQSISNLFQSIAIKDAECKARYAPFIFPTQEKALSLEEQEAFFKQRTESDNRKFYAKLLEQAIKAGRIPEEYDLKAFNERLEASRKESDEKHCQFEIKSEAYKQKRARSR